MQNLHYLLGLAFNKDTQIKSIRVGLIVGSLLNVINNGDDIFSGVNIDLLKVGLTFLTPYCVSIYTVVPIKTGK